MKHLLPSVVLEIEFVMMKFGVACLYQEGNVCDSNHLVFSLLAKQQQCKISFIDHQTIFLYDTVVSF